MCLITRVRGIQGVTPLIPASIRYIDDAAEILTDDCHHATLGRQMCEVFSRWLVQTPLKVLQKVCPFIAYSLVPLSRPLFLP
jgi:hypothetical protein